MGSKKNVLLITIDSLRADHVSCLGYYRKTTPFIDNLAKTGFLFTEAIANGSQTPTSVPALLTSSYPSMYGYSLHLSKSKTPIAEVLRASGYHTAAFHSNPYLSKYYGYDRGFDTFQDFIFFKQDNRDMMERIKSLLIKRANPPFFIRRAYGLLSQVLNLKPLKAPWLRAELINQRAVSWLRKHTDNFFLWMHYMDVHWPYQPPSEYLHQLKIEVIGKSQIIKLGKRMNRHHLDDVEPVSDRELKEMIDLYDGEIRYTDNAVSSLLMELEKLGIYDDTLIIITSDHGDEFNEHSQLGHLAKLYDELIRVPLVIKWPGSDGDVTIDQQVQLLDIAPTILEFSGIDKPANFLGTSLLSLMKGKTTSVGVVSETVHKYWELLKDGKGKRLTSYSYRTEEWKYISDEENQRGELYNLQNDPEEKRNLVDKEPEKEAEFRSRIMKHIQMEEESKEAANTAEKEKVRKKIKNLKRAGSV